MTMFGGTDLAMFGGTGLAIFGGTYPALFGEGGKSGGSQRVSEIGRKLSGKSYPRRYIL